MDRLRSQCVAAGLAILMLWATGAASVQAHARLMAAVPTADAVVAAPGFIRLQFSETLNRRFSSLRLTAVDGRVIALVPQDVREPRVLAASVSIPLAPGQYLVTWVAVADEDGHKTSGSFKFKVK